MNRIRQARVAAWAGALAGLGLAGCGGLLHSVDEGPSAPVPVSERFRHSTVGTSSIAQSRWWSAFKDPALDQIMAVAVDENLDLRRARERMLQAKAVRRGANSAWYPSLQASADASRTSQVFQFFGGQRIENSAWDLSIAASYELDLWGRINFSSEAAALEFRASSWDLETMAMSVSALVADTWFQLVEQRAALALVQSQLKTNQTFLELVELRFRQGQVGALDVYQQRQQVAASQARLPQLESAVAVLEHRLAVLLSRSPSAPDLPPQVNLPQLPAAPKVGVPATLLQRRPDIKAAQARVMAADNRVGAAIADQFPTLRLTASTGFRSFEDGPQELLRIDSLIWNLAAGLVGPLFDGFRRRAEVDRTKAALRDQLLAYGQAVLTAFQEVEDALIQEDRQRAYVFEVDAQVALAQETLAQAKNRYLNGLSDYLPVLNALTSLQQLEQAQLAAQRGLLSIRIQLYRALGGDWPAEIVSGLAAQDEGGEE